jgi:catechol 2,3-dioxygenase-like lactoylglutathione lyase family enzyme
MRISASAATDVYGPHRAGECETPPLASRGGCTVADVITGAHVIVYSRDAEADRVFFRDTLGYRHVDAGSGWLIFKLPPAEVAVHPSDAQQHELYLMCDDLDATMKMLADNGVGCSPPTDEGWGRLTRISLPGGGELGLYEPRHSRATAL